MMNEQANRAGWPPYDPSVHCPKCDGEDVATVWHDGYLSRHECAAVNLLETSYPGEHLCRSCRRCHYRWPEMTEDTPHPPRRTDADSASNFQTMVDPYEAARRAREASSAK
jgi:RNA polymerase subunit RPABC4/transcription elongation factor Spt4